MPTCSCNMHVFGVLGIMTWRPAKDQGDVTGTIHKVTLVATGSRGDTSEVFFQFKVISLANIALCKKVVAFAEEKRIPDKDAKCQTTSEPQKVTDGIRYTRHSVWVYLYRVDFLGGLMCIEFVACAPISEWQRHSPNQRTSCTDVRAAGRGRRCARLGGGTSKPVANPLECCLGPCSCCSCFPRMGYWSRTLVVHDLSACSLLGVHCSIPTLTVRVMRVVVLGHLYQACWHHVVRRWECAPLCRYRSRGQRCHPYVALDVHWTCSVRVTYNRTVQRELSRA